MTGVVLLANTELQHSRLPRKMIGPPTLHSLLHELATDNVQHYQHDDSEHGRRLFNAFTTLAEQVGVATPLYQQVQDVAGKYDFDASTPANGYRSCLLVMDACMTSAIRVSEVVAAKRVTVFFKKRHYTREAESVGELLTTLNICLRQLLVLVSLSNDKDLYVSDEYSAEFLRFADALNTAPFYGRLMGFQFVKSLKPMLRQIAVGMATYNEFYESKRWTLPKSAVSLWKGGRYLNNPDLRGKKLAHITKTATVEFLKSFWFLSESQLMYKMPYFVCPAIAVNKVITLHPEPLKHVTADGRVVEVPVPSAYFGPAPINVHLLSAVKRDGMGNNATAPASRQMIVHYHGGGFVAQTPKSHEIYLRDWAVQLNVPIVSIDYSLAPKAAFPRPLQDAVWAYMWARQNCRQLGSTGECVIMAGDSAGANLSLTTSLKCLELGLPAPDGLFLAYFPVLVSFTPSPSRALSFMDPMLPYGFLVGCINAYARRANEWYKDKEGVYHKINKEGGTTNGDIANDTKTINDNTTNSSISIPIIPMPERQEYANGGTQNNNYNAGIHLELQAPNEHVEDKNPKTFESVHENPAERDELLKLSVPRNADLSPWWATDEALRRLPPTSILTTDLDPCLDDCVMFARRLKRLDHDVTLDVVSGLPHGFLYFAMLSPEAKAGSDQCVQRIKQRLRLSSDQS